MAALKFVQWFNRGIQFGCSAIILGIYSYFLATLANHNLPINNTVRAVEGISGIAVLYTLAGLLLLCCLAGRTFSSFLAVVFDVAFIAAFIYVAVANRAGASSCDGYVDTPYGSGKAGSPAKGSDGFTSLPSYRVACRLQSACLAVSVIAIIFFIISILVEVALARSHNKEKRRSAAPQNDYSSTAPKASLFSRIFRRNTVKSDTGNTLPEHTLPSQLDATRPSHTTERTAVNHYPDNTYNKQEQGYGYLPQNDGFADRHDGYGQTHDGYGQTHDGYGQTHDGYGQGFHTEPTTGTARPAQNPNYRYDDGVYDRV